MVLSMDRWLGKVAIVTGASSGIGAAVAESLVNAGLVVVGLARRKEKIDALAAKLKDKKGQLYGLKCDMTKEADILSAFKWIKDNLGHVQILINNAGVVVNTNLLQGNTEAWKTTFEVNVLGLCIATREAINIMKRNNLPGHIVNINSVQGHRVFYVPALNVYSASKHAVTALTETFTREIRFHKIKNIKVTSVCPSLTESEMSAQLNLESVTHDRKFIPMLKAEDVADAVEYILSTPPDVQVLEFTIEHLYDVLKYPDMQ